MENFNLGFSLTQDTYSQVQDDTDYDNVHLSADGYLTFDEQNPELTFSPTLLNAISDNDDDDLLCKSLEAFEGRAAHTAPEASTVDTTTELASRVQPNNENLSTKQLANAVVNANTKRKSEWAMRIFRSWASWRKLSVDLITISEKELDEHLTRFIVEARKQDGSRYPGSTLHAILVSIQKYLALEGRHVQLIRNLNMPTITYALDKEMRESASAGLGNYVRQVDPVTEEHEEALWAQNVLGTETPRSLLRALFFAIGMSFGLRSGAEQRKITVTNFQIDTIDGKR